MCSRSQSKAVSLRFEAQGCLSPELAHPIHLTQHQPSSFSSQNQGCGLGIGVSGIPPHAGTLICKQGAGVSTLEH